MKIAYFLDIPKGLGGAGNVLLKQAKIMSSIHDVVVVIPFDEKGKVNPEYSLRCQNAYLRYVGLSYKTAFNLQYIDILAALENVKEIQKWAHEEQIDLFHSVQLNVAVELASRELGIPHLMNIYQLREEEFMFWCMDIFPKYHSSDSLLYCHIWEKNLGVQTCCIRPSSPLFDIHKKERKGKQQLSIVMLGSLCERKNQMMAIYAVENCIKNGEDVKLTIAGDDASEYGRKCREYVEKNYLKNNIFIMGFLSNVEPLLIDNDCYLCTSKDESFPSSIVEAITYDLTIITTPVAGVPELLKDKENAYVSSGYTEQEIENSIMECILGYRNGSVWKLHDKAELLWKRNFSVDIVKKQLNNYYQNIINHYKKEHRKRLEEKISIHDVQKVLEKISEVGEVPWEIRSRCYYYACLEKILGVGNAYIWGAGRFGKFAKELLELLFPQIKLEAYIDRKRQGDYLGIPIISPSEINVENIDYIFLGFAIGREEVLEYLQGLGFQYNRHVWLLP